MFSCNQCFHDQRRVIWLLAACLVITTDELCYTEKATKARHCQERQKQRHNQNHQTNQPSHNQTGNEQHYKPVHQTSDAPNTSASTPPPQINTQVTAHQRSIPQATHAHPRPRQSAHNNTATIFHTPVQARQALNHHDIACTQHRRHPPRVRGKGGGGGSHAGDGPKPPGREPREVGGKGGRKRGKNCSTEELWAGEGTGAAAAGVVDTSRGQQRGRDAGLADELCTI